MNIAKQLFELQDVDTELESDEQTLVLIMNRIGKSGMIVKAQEKLDSEKNNLEELTRQQHSLDWDIDDITGKIKKTDEDLYGGKIKNPKELTDLQHEFEILKANLARYEEQALDLMEKVEAATKSVSEADIELNRLKNEWQQQQKKLTADMENLKKAISGLKTRRQRMLEGIDPQTAEIYHELRKQRGTAVARVQQGTCLGCRISLPVSDLQRVKGGSMVRCSSCGRILYQA